MSATTTAIRAAGSGRMSAAVSPPEGGLDEAYSGPGMAARAYLLLSVALPARLRA